VNPNDTRAAREYLKDLKRDAQQNEAPRGHGQAAPLLLADLRKACAACPDTLSGLRDRALLLVAFSVAGRRSEVAGLRVSDVREDTNGLVITVRVSKTGVREVAVPYGSSLLTCPVRTWKEWKETAGLDEESPAFRRIDRHGNLLGGLSGAACGEIITRAAERAGVAGKMTGHSARAGLATSARQAGKSREAISATTGHAPGSRSLDAYIRRVDRWSPDENATAGIGL
jgi:integrase